MEIVTEECNSQFQSANKTTIGLSSDIREKVINEVYSMQSRNREEITQGIKQDMLELEDRIDLLES